jgi:hypothetical protein
MAKLIEPKKIIIKIIRINIRLVSSNKIKLRSSKSLSTQRSLSFLRLSFMSHLVSASFNIEFSVLKIIVIAFICSQNGSS